MKTFGGLFFLVARILLAFGKQSDGRQLRNTRTSSGISSFPTSGEPSVRILDSYHIIIGPLDLFLYGRDARIRT